MQLWAVSTGFTFLNLDATETRTRDIPETDGVFLEMTFSLSKKVQVEKRNVAEFIWLIIRIGSLTYVLDETALKFIGSL